MNIKKSEPKPKSELERAFLKQVTDWKRWKQSGNSKHAVINGVRR